jgi:hypothetical protein
MWRRGREEKAWVRAGIKVLDAAIGKLGIGRGRIDQLEIGELTVDRLIVKERLPVE